MSELRATVRLQFHQGFTLDDAVPLVDYFAQLGISHIYASPLFKAKPGSMHGYDVLDPTRINTELGGEAALHRLVEALRKQGMGLILDIVSNHMAVGGDSNPWWLDVLEWGVSSPYANFFDIEWRSHDPLLKGQLLVPFLRRDYGNVLEDGDITLDFDSELGAFSARHFEHRFPLCPSTYSDILERCKNAELKALARSFSELDQASDAWQLAKPLQQELRQAVETPEATDALATAIAEYDATNETGLQNFHQLLERQHYRLASWRTAADDINWRRFFDINELGGLCVERPNVFEATHSLIFKLIREGMIDGLRIDHVDGLANPHGYCRKLRRRINALLSERPSSLANNHFPIFVEKILGHGEKLATNWHVDGTTGYEFMNQVSLLQHDPVGELQLCGLWSDITGRTENFMDEVREARQLVLTSSLSGDQEAVAQGLLKIARNDIKTRDLTLGSIRRALLELIVHFPIYRTYAGACGRSAQDEHFFKQAMEGAYGTLPESDWPLLGHLNRWLGGEPLRRLPPGPERALRQKVLTRFQQLTSPAAAKAVEDTACYRSVILPSRTDVGFDPQFFSAPPDTFHKHCKERAQLFPNNLLATATHDHKRGEDVRARLAVLSERAAWFAQQVEQWRLQAEPLRKELDDGIAPSPADELILYETLVGSWHPELHVDDREGMQQYRERLTLWQEKAVREAKLRSSWSSPNEPYEAACRQFLDKLLTANETAQLRGEIAAAADSLAPAGALNSLTQVLLRLTAPGVPDLYQGTEFWDFSLVDPDNRRPVDFEGRINALTGHQDQSTGLAQLVEQWRNGHIKQWLIAKTLALRAAHEALFRFGDYTPLNVEGTHAGLVLAYARHYRNSYCIVIVPRLATGLLGSNPTPHISPEGWEDTSVLLPETLHQSPVKGLFCQAMNRTASDRIAVKEALAEFPVNIIYVTD